MDNLSYLAGLFDGEGFAGVYKPNQIQCGVHMTDYRGPEIFKKYFGGFISEPIYNRPNHKKTYRIAWTGNDAEKVLKTIFPLLIIKREQVEIVLKYWELLKSAPRWSWSQIIQEYKSELNAKYPHYGGAGRNTRGKDKKPRRKRGGYHLVRG